MSNTYYDYESKPVKQATCIHCGEPVSFADAAGAIGNTPESFAHPGCDKLSKRIAALVDRELQLIDSAPTDGSVVMVFMSDNEGQLRWGVLAGYNIETAGWYDGTHQRLRTPTHWMKCPKVEKPEYDDSTFHQHSGKSADND